MSKTKVAFIGCGGLANAMHYPSLAELETCDLVACCDLFEDKAKSVAEKFEIPKFYTDYKKMIDETEPDAVWVIMPPQHLYEPTSYCLGAGKHVMIEKPPALTTTQICNLAKKAEKADVLSMVAFNRRHAPVIVDLKKRIEEYGLIELASATFYKHYFAGEYYDGQIDILRCDAIHALDLVRFLCGGEVTDLISSVRKTAGEDYPNSWQALMEFDNGATGVLMAHWSGGKRFHHCEFHAKGASVFTEFEKDGKLWAGGKEEPVVEVQAADLAGSDQTHKKSGFFQECAYFLDCIQNNAMPSSHFADAIKTMELVDRIYEYAFRNL